MSPRLPAELSVGFEEIDGQHRLVLKHIESAVAALETGDRTHVKTALSALGDYLVAHFASEESYMAASGFPDRAKHKAAHDIFMQDFAQLGQELELAGLSPLVTQWIRARVPEWLRFHIQVNDVPLGQFLTARRFRPDAPATALHAKPRIS